MIFIFIAAVVAIGCVAASSRRLVFAIAPTALDHAVLREALQQGDAEAIARAVELEPKAAWERELFAAIDASPLERAALVNETLAEIDFRLERWGRVPRVAASIASSASFLCGAMVLRAGLSEVPGVSDASIDDVLNGAVANAIGVAALGVAAAVACIAIDAEARRAVKSRRLAADLLVERLERAQLNPSASASADAPAIAPKKQGSAAEVV